MMMKRLYSIFLMLAVLLTFLGGCDKQEPADGGDGTQAVTDSAETNDTTETGVPQTTDAVTEQPGSESLFSETAQQSIMELKTTISGEAGKTLGVMHLGVCDGTYDDVMKYIRGLEGIGDAYPWLAEMPEENFFAREGMELYAVIPGVGGIMTVYAYGMDPDNDYLPTRFDPLYEGGEPVLIQGNISDIVPNFEIAWDDESYYPSLSLENGLLLQSDTVLDLTPYEIVMPQKTQAVSAKILAGNWECAVYDSEGYEVLLYLTLTEDGGAAYACGYGNSEIAETFGGSWSMTDGVLELKLSGGVFDLEAGYVTEPHSLETKYSFVWLEEGMSFALTPVSGDLLFGDAKDDALTFLCSGPVHPAYDPMRGITASVQNPEDVIGDWYESHVLDDGTEISMHLAIKEDGTAVYRYGYAFGEIIEEFNGTWISDADGNFILDMHGGSLTADASELYDFYGKYHWDTYLDQLTLYHEEGNLLLSGTEHWVLSFAPFDFTGLDGEWVAATQFMDYRLQLFDDGTVNYMAEEDGVLVRMYTGTWYAPSDAFRLDLDMRLTAGGGELFIHASYDLEWTEFPTVLTLTPRGDAPALTSSASENDGDIFTKLIPTAVG